MNDFIAKCERHRSYLRVIARSAIPRKLQGRIDASDVVQETMIKAIADIGGFRGSDTQDMAAYLKRILRNHLADEYRKAFADKRDAALERSIDAAINDSTTRFGDLLPAHLSTPSKELQHSEKLAALADALCRLPDDQRTAIELHKLERLSLEETAATMQRTNASVAGLLRRGLAALNQAFSDQNRTDANE